MPDGTHVLVAPVADAAFTLTGTPIPEDDLLDVIGDTQAVIRTLQEMVGLLKSELPDKVASPRYREAGGRSATRSYNTDRILAKVAGGMDAQAPADTPGVSVPAVLGFLKFSDALRLTFRWTELKGVFEALDIPMTITSHEIVDGDLDADVGEVWTKATKVEAVPDAG